MRDRKTLISLSNRGLFGVHFMMGGCNFQPISPPISMGFFVKLAHYLTIVILVEKHDRSLLLWEDH